jgi:ubiquinone/menaquinone biosynthesis C-methylase UbiE
MNIKELQLHWDTFGRTDPLFAILTDVRKEGRRWSTDEFFAEGRKEIDDLMNDLESLELEAPRKRALDFGCGVGRLTQSLADHFGEICGLDIAPSMIELANKYNRHGDRCRYYLNQRNDLKLFDDGVFDFIYSNITLQHMAPKYSQGYIQEFVRILSPEGMLVFQLPDAPATVESKSLRHSIKSLTPNPLLKAYRKLRYGGLKPVMQMYGVNKDRIVSLLESCGAQLVSLKQGPMSEEGWVSYLYVARKSSSSNS